MELSGKVVVLTGAASGIGKALAARFAKAGVEGLVLADLDGHRVKTVASELAATGLGADVSKEADVQAVVQAAMDGFGRIDLFCSNAGISIRDPDIDNAASAPNEAWEKAWGVNVMAHVYAARACLPGMIERGEGYFLNTVSAAGLLSQIGSAVYSTTKHAAIGFGEHLAIAHKDHGIRVSLLCPQAVDTPMLGGAGGAQNVDGVMTPEAVADVVVEGLADERFLILPHDQVTTYMQRKTSDYDRWIGGMARLRRSVIEGSRGQR